MSEKAMAFVAVDLGASGGKVSLGVFDGEKFSLKDTHRFWNGGIDVWAHGSGTVEPKTYWDDLALFNNIVEGLRLAALESPVPITSVGIDAWGADAAMLNAHGELLGPIYCYRDHRLDDIRQELFGHISARELYEISGIPPQPWYLINQLFWLSKYRPDLLGLVDTVLPIAGLFQYYLCGAKVAETTFMAVQQLCSIGTDRYDARLLEAAGIPRHILPEVVPPGTVLGEIRPELAEMTGLRGCKVVAVKTHDTASAYTAAPVADRDKSLIISSGTWSLVGKLLERPLITEAVMGGMIANEGIEGDIRLLRNVMGTWPVQQLRDAWGKADGREIGWDEIVQLARSAPPLATVIDMDDQALYNPADMEQALRQQITRTGQAQPADRGAILRAVYEGLALKIAQVNHTVEQATASRHEVVHIVGGGARNALLNQFIADSTGLHVSAGPYEATCVGNILVQAVAGGVADTIDQARQIVSKNLPPVQFIPSAEHDWRSAGERLAGISG